MEGQGDVIIEVKETQTERRLKTDDSIVIQISDDIPDVDKREKPVLIPDNKIISASRGNPADNRYGSPYQGDGLGQTPYYQQQLVGGQPVYIQGTAPSNAATMNGPYRYRTSDDFTYSNSEFVFMSSFENQQIRSRFIQRVYIILTLQLAYTCAFICLCIFDVTFFIVYIALVCCMSARRIFPLNFILLAIFTMAMSYMLAITSLHYGTDIVLMSVGTTGAICLVVSIFATQTSFDFTRCLPFLMLISILTLVFGLIAMIIAMLTHVKGILVVYSGLIAFVFSMYLMFDTQMIMGGRRIELSPEEYIYGALTLYVDIIQILLALLNIFGESR